MQKANDGYFSHSPGSNESPFNNSSMNSPVKQNIQIVNDQLKQKFQQQQQPQPIHSTPPTNNNMISNNAGLAAAPTATNQRVINRNYLQIQSNNYNMANKANTLTTNTYSNITQPISIQDPLDKRTRSISRSLRSLFNRSASNRGTITAVQKREKSYEPYSNSYDIQSG